VLADHARQALSAAGSGDDSNVYLGLTELGRLGSYDNVAIHNQLAAAAERESADCRNDWFFDVANAIPGGEAIFEHNGDGRLIGHLFDVRSSRECTLVAGENNYSYVVVAIEFFQRDNQLVHQFVVQGI